MAENNQQQRQSTSTMIRNIYSNDISYINIKFFNTELTLQFFRFLSKDSVGKSTYDKNGVTTTIRWESAFTIFKVAQEIYENTGAAAGCNLSIECGPGATLVLERKMGTSNQMETWLTITKNGITIPFKFATQPYQVNENGTMVTKVIDKGIGHLCLMMHGYLTGINADRHLDKMTEDYVKSLGNNAFPQQGGGSFQTNSGYQKNNNYQQRGNNNRSGQYRKPYTPYNQQNQNQGPPPQQQSWEQQAPNTQGISNWAPQ